MIHTNFSHRLKKRTVKNGWLDIRFEMSSHSLSFMDSRAMKTNMTKHFVILHTTTLNFRLTLNKIAQKTQSYI